MLRNVADFGAQAGDQFIGFYFITVLLLLLFTTFTLYVMYMYYYFSISYIDSIVARLRFPSGNQVVVEVGRGPLFLIQLDLPGYQLSHNNRQGMSGQSSCIRIGMVSEDSGR